MSTWKYLFGIMLISVLLIGCSAPSQEEVNDKPVEQVDEKPKRTDFGDAFIEKENMVAYVNSENDLYLYNHSNEEEFLVHEDVGEFALFNEHVFFIADDGITSELEIPLQAIYRTHMESKETEKMVAPQEVDGAYTTPRSFSINDHGNVALKTEVGFFYSNFWYDYTLTNSDFSSEVTMITLEDEYDSVINEMQWQGNEIFFLVDRISEQIEDGELHTELHAFSVEDGADLIQEKVLPLSSKEFSELYEYTIYIRVEDEKLYILALNDNDEAKLSYTIHLQTHEIINKTIK